MGISSLCRVANLIVGRKKNPESKKTEGALREKVLFPRRYHPCLRVTILGNIDHS